MLASVLACVGLNTGTCTAVDTQDRTNPLAFSMAVSAGVMLAVDTETVFLVIMVFHDAVAAYPSSFPLGGT